MGNQLIKNYDIEKEPYATGGNSSLWNVYRGNKQEKGRTQVSIFIIDKKAIEKNYKQYKEEILSFIRKEYTCLSRFKHPQILNIIEPLIEDQKSMAFITEYVDYSLQSCINKGQYDLLAGSELELKIHFDELLRVLQFINNNGYFTCLGISPENIWVTKNGKWKLGGFLFSTQVLQSTAETNNIDLGTKMYENYIKFYPNLNFTANEVVNIPSQCSFYSDVFSLGMLFLTICKCKYEKSCNDPYLINANNKYTYEQGTNKLQEKIAGMQFFTNQPQNLQKILLRMVDKNQFSRASIGEIQSCDWLNDPYVKAIKHLETINDIEKNQQANFLKGLQQIIFRYEEKLLKKRIIPNLMHLLQYPHLVPQLLLITIDIMKKENYITKSEFNEICWVYIKYIAASKEMSAQALYLYVENSELFALFVQRQEYLTFMVPLCLKCFEFSVPKLQELAISKTEFLMKYLDYNLTKSQLLPRILKVCTDSSIQVRKSALTCLKKIYPNIDKATINEQVLGTLQKVRKIGSDSQISMILLQIYQGIAKDLGIDSIGSTLLPQLIPFLIDPNISKAEYVEYSKTIQQLLKRIDDERLQILSTNGSSSINNNFNFENQIQEQEKNQNQQGSQSNKNQPTSTQNEFDFLSQFEKQIQQPQPQSQSTVNTANNNLQSQNQSQSDSNQPQQNANNNAFLNFDFNDQAKQNQQNAQQQQQSQQQPIQNNNDFDFNFDDFQKNNQGNSDPTNNNNNNNSSNTSNNAFTNSSNEPNKTSNVIRTQGKLPIFPSKDNKQQQKSQSEQLNAFSEFNFDTNKSSGQNQQQQQSQQQQKPPQKVDPFFEKFNKQQQQQQQQQPQKLQLNSAKVNSTQTKQSEFNVVKFDMMALNKKYLNSNQEQEPVQQQKIQLKNLNEVNFFDQKPFESSMMPASSQDQEPQQKFVVKKIKSFKNSNLEGLNKGHLLQMDYDPFSEIETLNLQQSNSADSNALNNAPKSESQANIRGNLTSNPFLDNEYNPDEQSQQSQMQQQNPFFNQDQQTNQNNFGSNNNQSNQNQGQLNQQNNNYDLL